MGEDEGEVEDELIAWVGGAREADWVAQDEVGWGMRVRRGRDQGDEVAAEGLPRNDEGGDGREGEEGRILRGGVVLVTRLHDGVLGDLVNDFRTLDEGET